MLLEKRVQLISYITLARHDDYLKSANKLKRLSPKNSLREKRRVYRKLHPKLLEVDEFLLKSSTDTGDKDCHISTTLHFPIRGFSEQFFRLCRGSLSEVFCKKGVSQNSRENARARVSF